MRKHLRHRHSQTRWFRPSFGGHRAKANQQNYLTSRLIRPLHIYHTGNWTKSNAQLASVGNLTMLNDGCTLRLYWARAVRSGWNRWKVHLAMTMVTYNMSPFEKSRRTIWCNSMDDICKISLFSICLLVSHSLTSGVARWLHERCLPWSSKSRIHHNGGLLGCIYEVDLYAHWLWQLRT